MPTPPTSLLGREPLNHRDLQYLIPFVTAATFRALP